MKFIVYILTLCLLIATTACNRSNCPANSKESSHRQLTKINSKRKRDRGLFPKSYRPENRKAKKKKPEEAPEENTTETTETL